MEATAKKNILIVGGGFSGLTLSALLARKNQYNITLIEKEAFGVQQSEVIENVLVEHAAPSLLNHHLLEEFFKDFGYAVEPSNKSAKKRYLWSQGLKRWPLGLGATIQFVFRLFSFWLIADKSKSLEGMTVERWSELHFGPPFTDKVLRPAMYGIYASDIRELDAELTLARFFRSYNKNKSKIKGSVIPVGGISPFLKSLKSKLVKEQVQIVKKNLTHEELTALKRDHLVIFATSFSDFSALLKKDPAAFLEISNVQNWLQASQNVTSISLSKIHLFFDRPTQKLDGFGVLFHPADQFNSLGFVANSNVFKEYSALYNEAWIARGEPDLGKVLADRKIVFAAEDVPLKSCVRFHPNVYPVYNKQLKNWLSITRLQKNIYATGNYWGALGLTQIFLQNLALADRIEIEQK